MKHDLNYEIQFIVTSLGDHGWTYAHELGKQMVEKRFGNDVKISVVENVPEGPDATRVIRELAKQGNEIIFTTSFGYLLEAFWRPFGD